MTKEEALDKFKALMQNQNKTWEIDPEEGLDWFSVSVGYFLALGLSPSDAIDLAIHARYDKHYWNEEL